MMPPDARLAIAAHLAFNAILLALFLPLLGPLDRLCRLLWPDPATERGETSYLDDAALETPALALGGAAREVLRIGDKVALMMELNLRSLLVDDPDAGRDISKLDDRVDAALTDLKLYFARLGRTELSRTKMPACAKSCPTRSIWSISAISSTGIFRRWRARRPTGR